MGNDGESIPFRIKNAPARMLHLAEDSPNRRLLPVAADFAFGIIEFSLRSTRNRRMAETREH
jgi:hypothetical protein